MNNELVKQPHYFKLVLHFHTSYSRNNTTDYDINHYNIHVTVAKSYDMSISVVYESRHSSITQVSPSYLAQPQNHDVWVYKISIAL